MGIAVKDLEKSYGANRIVDRVSFAVEPGELVALLGPSGGGKSTILRIIAGLEVQDGGEVSLGGRPATHTPVQERGIGFVFQHYALFRHMTVSENVAFGLRIRKRPKQETERKVAELLDLVQLGGFGARYPTQLSGGQRQRVALARALAPDPKFLLLDEPFGALDAKVRLELREWLHRFHEQRSVTSIFVTHDQAEAMELADRVVVVHRGKVEQIGTPDEIYDQPATEFVASFVGATSVLNGEVTEGRAAFGTLAVRAPPGADDGRAVRAFVRPHDIELHPPVDAATDDRAFASALIERISRIGWTVKVDVRLDDGQPLSVELTKDRAQELGLSEGDRVLVNLRDAKIFWQDYAI